MIRQTVQKLLFRLGWRLVRAGSYADPIAPFDALDLAVRAQQLQDGDDFGFVYVGTGDGLGKSALQALVHRHGLRGWVVSATQEAVAGIRASHPDVLAGRHNTLATGNAEYPSDRQAPSPALTVSLLYVDAEDDCDAMIGAAFEAGIFPPIVRYEWAGLSDERRFLLKMKLLDNGYRFIDIGAETVCLSSGVDHAQR